MSQRPAPPLALTLGLALLLSAALPASAAHSRDGFREETIEVQLTPGSASTLTGGQVTFTATVSGTRNTSVQWYVDGRLGGSAASGTVSGSGDKVVYTAPAVAGSHQVTAVSASNTRRSASATVTVTAPAVHVSLNPPSAAILTNGTATFTATVTGSSNTAVTWMVDTMPGGNAASGTLALLTGNQAVYSAPASAGAHTVTAVSQADSSKSASALVTVTAPVVAVTLSPDAIALPQGGSATFTATVAGSANTFTAPVTGTTTTGVTWTVDRFVNGNATVGTLVPGPGNTAAYTAPAASGSHTVTATSLADSTQSASASVTVQPLVLTLNPAAVTLPPNGAAYLFPGFSGSGSSAITWTVDTVANGNPLVGTISPGPGGSAIYTAPAATGPHTVTATSVIAPSISASAQVNVQNPLGTVALNLASAGSGPVDTGGTMLFTASATGTGGSGVAWTVDGISGGNTTAGTVTGAGNVVLYTAPVVVGSHVVTATSLVDPTQIANSTVTVATTAYTVTGSVYNVQTAYGATGNGSSDDTAAIQKAITAASGAGGGVVEVPAGTYLINLGYQGEYGLLMKSGVTLQLDAGATLQAKTGAPGTSYMILFNGGSNMNIVGPGTLDGSKAAIGLHGSIELIGFWGGSNIVLAGFTCQNSPGDGIYISGYPAGAGIGAPVTNVLIYGVTCTGNGRNGMSPIGCNGLVVRDSTFSNQTSGNPMNGIDIEPVNQQAPNNFQIFNCVFSGNSGGGIQSGPDDSGDNATFTSMTYAFNTVSGNGNYGIEAQNGAGPFLILGNTISATGPSYEFQGYGICLRGEKGISNVTIQGNTVTGSHSDGIFLSSASSSLCTGNTVTGSGGNGIDNLSGSGVTISGNSESGNAGSN